MFCFVLHGMVTGHLTDVVRQKGVPSGFFSARKDKTLDFLVGFYGPPGK